MCKLLLPIFALVCSFPYSTPTTFNITTAITEAVLLQCKIDVVPNKDTMVIWLGPKDQLISADKDMKISDSRFELYIPNNKLYNIRIKSVKKKDEGLYECRVMQGSNKLSFDLFKLTVQTPPTMITAVTNEEVLKEGDTKKLPCKAKGDPQPTLKWQFFDPDKPDLYTEIPTETPELLTLPKVSLSSNGRYECVADNGVVPSHKSVYNVVVKAPPKIQVPYMKVSQGMGKELWVQCLVHWKPEGHVKWFFNNKNIISTPDSLKESKPMYRPYMSNENRRKTNMMESENSKNNKYRIITHNMTSKSTMVGLMIKNFSKLDIGRYKCIANNEEGSHEAGIIALGDESSESKDINVIVGDDVVIPCNNNNNNNKKNKNKNVKNSNNNNDDDDGHNSGDDKNDKNKNKKNKKDVTWWRQTSKMEDFGIVVISQIKPLKSEKFQMLQNDDLKIISVGNKDSGFYRCSTNKKDGGDDDDDDGGGDDDDEMVYLSVTATSASSLKDHNKGMISIKTFCIVIAVIFIVLTTVFITLLFVLKKRSANNSFNFDEQARFKQ